MEEKAKKAVIYIDTEDEITDVVNKIKDSNEKIIALVPPKGIGILRSAVNLRILARSSKKIGKQIVLVSNNEALRAMAGSAEIPVAKTLQSKPEIPEIEALEIDGEDVIDGEKMPISEFAGKSKEEEEAEILSNLDIGDNKTFSKVEPEVERKNRKKSSDKPKVPDFNSFRKKIFIFGGVGVFLIIFLVWAIFFAPAAKVIVSAKTSDVNISDSINLTSSQSSANPEKGTLLLSTQTIEKSSEVSFDATGTKEEGEAATGILTLSQSSESSPVVVKSGSAFSAGNCNFVTTSTATIPGATLKGGAVHAGSTTVGIRATQIGEQCNLSAQSYVSSVSGVSALGGQLSGGSKTTKKVVSESDVATAKAKLSQFDVEQVKAELKTKFDSNYVVLAESFTAQVGEAESSPVVNAEASNGKATLKATSKYTLSAVSKDDVEKYLKSAVKNKVDSFESKKIYESGASKAEVSDFSGNSQSATAKVYTTAKVGPAINEDSVKKQIFGKKYSEVRNIFEKIDGVNDVEVKFSYFWVSTVPSDENKVEIEFTVSN